MFNSLESAIKNSREKIENLSPRTREVYEEIEKEWPTNPVEIGRNIENTDELDRKKASSKYLYHFKKLENSELIDMKKLGQTYVAWPKEIEKLRFIKEMVNE